MSTAVAVSKGNSRSVSIVILLSSPSQFPPPPLPLARPPAFASPCPANYRRIYKEQRIYKPTEEWPFLFATPDPEIVGKYRKSGPRTMECTKETRARYIARDERRIRAQPANENHACLCFAEKVRNKKYEFHNCSRYSRDDNFADDKFLVT